MESMDRERHPNTIFLLPSSPLPFETKGPLKVSFLFSLLLTNTPLSRYATFYLPTHQVIILHLDNWEQRSSACPWACLRNNTRLPVTCMCAWPWKCGGVWWLCVSQVEEQQTALCVKVGTQFTFPLGVHGDTHDLRVLINAAHYLSVRW